VSRARQDDLEAPDGRLLALQMIVAGAVMGGVRPAASYRALELGSDAFGIGVLAASFAAGTIVFAIPLGRLKARLGPQPVLVAGAAESR
jgi:MFS family permease